MNKLLFYIILLHAYTNASLLFHSPQKLSGTELRSEQFLFVGNTTKVNLTDTRLVTAQPRDLCSHAKNEDRFPDNIVIVSRDNCSPVTKFKNAQRGGAVAIVIMDSPFQFFDLAGSYYGHVEGISMPGVSVLASTEHQYKDIFDCELDEDVVVNVTLIAVNIYEGVYISFSVLVGLWSLINVILGIRKLLLFFRATQRFRLELPEMCIAIEVAASLERLLLCPEPDAGTGRGLYEYQAIIAFQTFSIVWSTIATMIMASYWVAAFQNWMPSANSCIFKYWKIPLIALSLFLFFLDLVISILRSVYIGGSWLRMTETILGAIILFFIAILFVISGMKVLLFAKQAQGHSSSSSPALQRLAFFVVANAAALLVSITGVFLVGLAPKDGYNAGLLMTYLAISMVSTLQIMVFQPPDETRSSEGSLKLSKVSTEDHTTLSEKRSQSA